MTTASSAFPAKALAAAAFAAALAVAACGGGGGGGGGGSSPPPPPPPPPTGGGPTWTPGVYQAASLFKDRCQAVRSGIDPITGLPFPDDPGSLVEEMFWLRSWTHETYLWNNEVPDINPRTFTNRVAYFDELKTDAITPSGKPKDDFHFSIPSDEYADQVLAEPTASYGAVIGPMRLSNGQLAVTPPRDFRVYFTEPGSPAAALDPADPAKPKMIRGSRILQIDGVDLVNNNTQAGIDVLNAGLFPSAVGQTHTFVVQDPGESGTRTVSLTSALVSETAAPNPQVIDTDTGSVGYLLLNTFGTVKAERQLYEAMTTLDGIGVSDLIIDLRYNSGGFLGIAGQLGYMVAGDAQTNGKDFFRFQYNADAGGSDPVNGGPNEPIPFIPVGLGFDDSASGLPVNAPLPSLDLTRVFILTGHDEIVSAGTCSASEAVINGLRGIDVEVVLIGDQTCGKPYGFSATDNCGETYFTIQFKGTNNKGFGDYADGFAPEEADIPFTVEAPGCFVRDDLDHQLGAAEELRVLAALYYRENGFCPTIPALAEDAGGSLRPQAAGALALQSTGRTELQELLRSNLDTRMPY